MTCLVKKKILEVSQTQKYKYETHKFCINQNINTHTHISWVSGPESTLKTLAQGRKPKKPHPRYESGPSTNEGWRRPLIGKRLFENSTKVVHKACLPKETWSNNGVLIRVIEKDFTSLVTLGTCWEKSRANATVVFAFKTLLT